MTDWKEERIETYRTIEQEKELVKEKMDKDPSLSKLQVQLEDIKHHINVEERGYKEDIETYDKRLQVIKEDLVARWDTSDKSFKCDTGSATIRTTRSLKVDNEVRLIDILQRLGTLWSCIKTWDLTYLRKLADADLLDEYVVHYDEKKNVVISAAKKESGRNDK